MAVGDAHVFPGFLTPVLTLPSFQSYQLLFSHAFAEVRGENKPVRKFSSTGSQTHNHQVMSLTCSALKRRKCRYSVFSPFSQSHQYLTLSIRILEIGNCVLTLSQTSPCFLVPAVQVF